MRGGVTGNRLVCSGTRDMGLVVREDVDDVSVRPAKEEASYSPGLVGEWMDDVRASCDRSRVGGVDVVDLDRELGGYVGGGIAGDQTHLHLGVRRVCQRRDPAVIHDGRESEHVGVEPGRLGDRAAGEVGDNSIHGHVVIMSRGGPGRLLCTGGLNVIFVASSVDNRLRVGVFV